jgi:hypothetical protein
MLIDYLKSYEERITESIQKQLNIAAAICLFISNLKNNTDKYAKIMKDIAENALSLTMETILNITKNGTFYLGDKTYKLLETITPSKESIEDAGRFIIDTGSMIIKYSAYMLKGIASTVKKISELTTKLTSEIITSIISTTAEGIYKIVEISAKTVDSVGTLAGKTVDSVGTLAGKTMDFSIESIQLAIKMITDATNIVKTIVQQAFVFVNLIVTKTFDAAEYMSKTIYTGTTNTSKLIGSMVIFTISSIYQKIFSNNDDSLKDKKHSLSKIVQQQKTKIGIGSIWAGALWYETTIATAASLGSVSTATIGTFAIGPMGWAICAGLLGTYIGYSYLRPIIGKNLNEYFKKRSDNLKVMAQKKKDFDKMIQEKLNAHIKTNPTKYKDCNLNNIKSSEISNVLYSVIKEKNKEYKNVTLEFIVQDIHDKSVVYIEEEEEQDLEAEKNKLLEEYERKKENLDKLKHTKKELLQEQIKTINDYDSKLTDIQIQIDKKAKKNPLENLNNNLKKCNEDIRAELQRQQLELSTELEFIKKEDISEDISFIKQMRETRREFNDILDNYSKIKIKLNNYLDIYLDNLNTSDTILGARQNTLNKIKINAIY